MELKEILLTLRQFPEVYSVTVGNISIHLSHTLPTNVQSQNTAALVNDMPPDDVMMFASSPVFDEMVDAAKVKE